MEKHYTTREAANILGMSAGTLKNWRYEGIGPEFVRFGEKTVRYPESKLEEWLNEKRNNA